MNTPDPNTDRYLTTQEAAEVVRLSPATLATKRHRGDGPPFVKAGDGRFSRVLYRESELRSWLDNRRRVSTSPRTITGGQG